MKFSIWHIFIPIVAILSIEIPVEKELHFLWVWFFSLILMALPMAIFHFVHEKESWSDYIFIKNDKVSKHHQIIMIIFVLFLGSWIPYIDSHFITYKYAHFFTSSVLPFLVMSTLVNFFKTEWNRRLLVFFGLAFSGHLVYTALKLFLPGIILTSAWIWGAFIGTEGSSIRIERYSIGLEESSSVRLDKLFFVITLLFINGISVFFLSYRTHKKLVPSKAEEKI